MASALITGCATGIGAAVAHALSKRGYHLTLCDYDAAGLMRTVSSPWFIVHMHGMQTLHPKPGLFPLAVLVSHATTIEGLQSNRHRWQASSLQASLTCLACTCAHRRKQCVQQELKLGCRCRCTQNCWMCVTVNDRVPAWMRMSNALGECHHVEKVPLLPRYLLYFTQASVVLSTPLLLSLQF